MRDQGQDFPPQHLCTAWEDCQHDGICHDQKSCGAIGPNHEAFYGIDDDATPKKPATEKTR